MGTIEPRKNVGTLLDAYEQLLSRPAQAGRYGEHLPELVLAGKATPAARPWLDRLKHPPLRGAVRHLGYVDADRRRSLYEGARLLVLPSLDEGFGLPVLEAMATGVPVVAANRGALPEVVGGAGPLIDPESPEDLAAAIERSSRTMSLRPRAPRRGWRGRASSSGPRPPGWSATCTSAAIEHKRCASA